MEFSKRQKQIIEIVKSNEPISGDNIASQLGLTRPTLRNDLSILTMTGVLDARPKVGYIYSGAKIEPLLYEKLFSKKVEELMFPAIFVQTNTSLKEAVTTLFMYDVGSLYVQDDSKNLVGVLSRKDLLRGVLNNDSDSIPVAVVMSRMPNILTVSKDETLLAAGKYLMDHQVDSLPVVSDAHSSKVIGKITKTRLLNHFIEEGLKVNKTHE